MCLQYELIYYIYLHRSEFIIYLKGQLHHSPNISIILHVRAKKHTKNIGTFIFVPTPVPNVLCNTVKGLGHPTLGSRLYNGTPLLGPPWSLPFLDLFTRLMVIKHYFSRQPFQANILIKNADFLLMGLQVRVGVGWGC